MLSLSMYVSKNLHMFGWSSDLKISISLLMYIEKLSFKVLFWIVFIATFFEGSFKGIPKQTEPKDPLPNFSPNL